MTDLFDLPFEEDPDTPAATPQHTRPALPSQGGRPRASSLTQPADRPVTGDAEPASARRVLSVTELTLRVRDVLEDQISEVWVEGELSNCRLWNGHLYFTLKDSSSQLRGFMFKSALRYLKFKPGDGTHVIARGRISVYEPRGEYQLVCEHLEPRGLGALQLAFEQLKQRLQDEGLFDTSKKRALPALPRKIGIVTSLEGAAIRDVIKVLRRRFANLHLVVRPVRVQGEDASLEIAQGLRQVARVPGVDVIIVGRGGGSIEDLWAFNEEVVARAIARSPVPVVSAVGHETDFTIADFVADVRAPTPSAAAELVIARKDEFRNRIDRLRDRLRATAVGRVERLGRRAHALAGRPALAGFPGRLAMRGRHVSELAHDLAGLMRLITSVRLRRVQSIERQLAAFDAARRIAGIRSRLMAADPRLAGAMMRRRDRAGSRLTGAVGRLESMSPLAVLSRGYAVCWDASRTRVIRAASDVEGGETVRVTLSRGEIEAKVSKIE
jgi:exodeoxyribonuclease VII large subunit